MQYIKGFDSLRGIAIIYVIITHMGLSQILPNNFFIKTRLWSLISAETGIQIFFTLSGFLITTIFLSERHNLGKIKFYNFFVRRFLRLLPPLLIFYLAIALLTQQGIVVGTTLGYLFSIFFLYNFIPIKYVTGAMPGISHLLASKNLVISIYGYK